MKKEVLLVIALLIVPIVIAAPPPETIEVNGSDIRDFFGEEPVEPVEEPTPEPIAEPVPEPVALPPPVKQPRTFSQKTVDTQKTKQYQMLKTKTTLTDRSIYQIKITAIKSFDEITITETIPKELAQDVSVIKSTIPFEVIEEDPVIMFTLSRVAAQENATITYTITGDLHKTLSPHSLIVATEQALNPGRSRGIKAMAYLLAFVLGFAVIFPRRFLREHYKDAVRFASNVSDDMARDRLKAVGWAPVEINEIIFEAKEKTWWHHFRNYMFEFGFFAYLIVFGLFGLRFTIVTDQMSIMVLLFILNLFAIGYLIYLVKKLRSLSLV